MFAIGAFAAYYFMMVKTPTKSTTVPETTVEVSPVPESELEKELETLNVGDVDSEFTDVDKDINSL